jgi:hypothetical protein
MSEKTHDPNSPRRCPRCAACGSFKPDARWDQCCALVLCDDCFVNRRPARGVPASGEEMMRQARGKGP